MATYNGADYLREQLDSILNQTVPAFEIVVCDDCSTDNTWPILIEYAKKYNCFKIVQNEKNIGFLHNFEKVINLCSGDYIALSDQDDIWLPHHLQTLLEGMGNKMLSVGDAELIDSYGNLLGYKLSYCENLDFIPKDDLQKAYFILFHQNPYQGASMMFRKTFREKALPIPEGIICHDIWFGLLACFYGGFQPLKETVTLYRRHNKALAGYKRRKSRLRVLISHLLFNRTNHRSEMVSAIKYRINNLNREQLKLIQDTEKYYIRKKNFSGRMVNLIFDLKYYKLIYGTKK